MYEEISTLSARLQFYLLPRGNWAQVEHQSVDKLNNKQARAI